MQLSRRGCLQGLAALPLATITGPTARAGPAGGFASTWSGITDDGGGRASRYRLVITPEGEATVYAIDVGYIDAKATRVDIAGSTIEAAWATLGASVRGTLAAPDRIDAVLTASGGSQRVTLTRGDLYPVNRTVLPPGPMTAARLRALRQIAGAPAIGVGWAFRDGRHVVLVDGVRALGSPGAVTPADSWHIGSDTKSMTATLVARLVEAGRLRWTTTVGELLSPMIPDIRADYRQVDLVRLLSHHAGLPRDAPTAARRFTVGPVADIRAERLAYARLALAQPPVAAPGAAMVYSNAGYVVVGAMLEQAMGAPWEALIAEHLFAPLGLRSAGFGPPARAGRRDQPVGHARGLDNKLHPWTRPDQADLPTVIGPAGLVHASLGDLLTYLAAHLDRPARLLGDASWAKLQTPPFGDGYALGWGVDADGRLGHAGSNQLWLANVAVDRPAGLVFVGALNAATPEAPAVLQQAMEAARRSG